jgi:hypothetical protein
VGSVVARCADRTWWTRTIAFTVVRAVHLEAARRLYEWLGYQAAGRQHASWEYEDDDGVLRLYETTLTILRKRL